MKNSGQSELLEIYKLHAELADRVSQRREGANRLYVSLLVGLVVFLAALIRFGIGDAPERLVLSSVGVFGALLSVSWFVVILVYKQLNREKIPSTTRTGKEVGLSIFHTRMGSSLDGREKQPILESDKC